MKHHINSSSYSRPVKQLPIATGRDDDLTEEEKDILEARIIEEEKQ